MSVFVAWQEPVGGPHHVAIPSATAEARAAEIAAMFGRPLARDSHDLTLVGTTTTYAIFNLTTQAEANAFMAAFGGEPFNPRDRGSGAKWMYWFKGRNAKRRENRNSYDFSKD